MADEEKLRPNSTLFSAFAIALALVLQLGAPAAAAEASQYKVAGELAVYLGVVPAAIIKGHSPDSSGDVMHGGPPRGPHQYHLVIAVFDKTTGARIADAGVTARVSGLGLSGAKHELERMEIAKTVTYGGFLNFPGRDLYTIRVTIQRAGAAQPTVVDFKYDHRR